MEIASQRANRAAQMAQADGYVESLKDRAESNSAGNRAAQMTEAERYLEQLQDRAESNCSAQLVTVADAYHSVGVASCVEANGSTDGNDEFLPGSHHVPIR